MSNISDGTMVSDLIETLSDDVLGACLRAVLLQCAAAAKEK